MPRSTSQDFILPTSPWLLVMNLGLLAIVIATALPLLMIEGPLFRYIYTAGAAIALIGKIAAPGYKGTIVRVVRLTRIDFWSIIAFCVAAFFIWYNPLQNRDWLAFTLAGGVLQIYASLMINFTLKREQAARQQKN